MRHGKRKCEEVRRNEETKHNRVEAMGKKQRAVTDWCVYLTRHSIIAGPMSVCEYCSDTSLVKVVPLYGSFLMRGLRPAHVEGGGAYGCYDWRLHILWYSLDCHCHHLNTHPHTYRNKRKHTKNITYIKHKKHNTYEISKMQKGCWKERFILLVFFFLLWLNEYILIKKCVSKLKAPLSKKVKTFLTTEEHICWWL